MKATQGKVVIHDYWADHVGPWLQSLIRHFEGRGVTVEVWDQTSFQRGSVAPLKRPYQRLRGVRQRLALRSILRGVDHVFMWNGQNDHHRLLVDRCRAKAVPVSYLEVGYFPQKSYYTIDSAGINATAALMGDSLDWVGEKELAAMEAFRARYLVDRKWRGGGGFTLVPLQLSTDTNIRDHSQFQDMQAFVKHCEETIDGPIVFKTHPLDETEYTSEHEVRRSGSFLDMAEVAEKVVGLNSTCLLESSLLGVPTEAQGNGFLRAHSHQPEKLMAALVDRQVPVAADDISRWLGHYASGGAR